MRGDAVVRAACPQRWLQGDPDAGPRPRTGAEHVSAEATWRRHISLAAAQAKAANAFVIQLAGVSTNHGSAEQMAGAAQAVEVGGYWLNVPGPNPDFAKAVAFLKLMAAKR